MSHGFYSYSFGHCLLSQYIHGAGLYSNLMVLLSFMQPCVSRNDLHNPKPRLKIIPERKFIYNALLEMIILSVLYDYIT